MYILKYYSNHLLSRGWFRIVAVLAIVMAVLAAGLCMLIYTGVFGHIPAYEELKNIRHYEASSVYSSDGELLGRYYLQNRDPVDLEDVSPDFLDALLAIEDIRFYRHNGLDYRAVARVLVRTLLMRQDAGGGSTLSQQLAKNLYPRQSSLRITLPAEKIREIIIARRMERLHSKDEILKLYVNSVSFGEDTWGIKTASERFFNTPPDQLKLHQAATLAGMLQATTWYNPRRNPDHALHRRNVVLLQMERYGMIDIDSLEAARNRPLDLDYHRRSHSVGSAPHFREHLRNRAQHILTALPEDDGRKYNLYTDGLVIETTIHSGIQQAAEQAVALHLSGLQSKFDELRNNEPVFSEDDLQVYRAWRNSDYYHLLKGRGLTDDEILEIFDKPVPMDLFTHNGPVSVDASPRDSIRHYLSLLNTGFLAMDAANGDILAWVGSIDHRHFQYDHVHARRQTGSAFKPVVYAAALESGMEPCDYRRNLLSTYVSYDEWTPSNLQDNYGGHYSLQAALSRSVNTIAVDLIMETGVEEVRQTARRMGIHSHIPTQPSIALGTAEMSLMEMVRAYSAFANRGIPATPRYIKRIYNSRGVLIYDNTTTNLVTGQSGRGESEFSQFLQARQPTASTQHILSSQFPIETALLPEAPPATLPTPAISETTAAAMIDMLSRSVDNGSAQALRSQFGIRHALAGKTGTTQNHADGWFIGLTPDMVFGSWVGGTTPRVHLPESIGFASQTALPIAGHFLRRLEQSGDLLPPSEQFHPHQQNTTFVTNCQDYLDERFIDRVRDRIRGRDSREARIVNDNDDDSSIMDRVRGWFGRD